MTLRYLLFTLGIALPAVLFVALLHTPLASVEDQVTTLKYRLRGERQADTNIVIVYVDNEAIVSLGYPVRRNFYALMVKALSDLHVRAIGIDVLFENASSEYPEYDDLLAHVIGGSGNVVLSSYFRNVSLEHMGSTRSLSDIPHFQYSGVSNVPFFGSDARLPLSALLFGAAGIGHGNTTMSGEIPAFIISSGGVIPALALEVLRVYMGADRTQVRAVEGSVVIGTGPQAQSMTLGADGTFSLNFPGSISSFAAYPFVEVLRSYDAIRAGRTPRIPVGEFKDKIVLIGVIAEGRSEFLATPVDTRFPSIGLHAVFLDNALRSDFLYPFGDGLLLPLFIGFVCAAATLFVRAPVNRFAGWALLAVLVIVSFLLFILGSYLLPLVPTLAVGVIATTFSLFYKHRFVREQLSMVQREKESIMAKLRDKEAKVALLERELFEVDAAGSADRTSELLGQIQRYKAEIRLLSSRVDDLEEHSWEGEEDQAMMQMFEGIIYRKGGKMHPVIDFVSKIADSDAPVLILGESGTGKELVARAIHRRSARSAKPFIAVNCGALAESLLESELFGHEKGAFTGAVKERMGRFELANGGTIFLDEIGEVNESFQLKLLRVLQEGEFERVGGAKTIKVDVRVVAATNKNLREQVKQKRFRDDLYYRLNVLTVALPPLAQREEDIPLLISHFLKREGGQIGISKNVMEALQNHGWRGNIRELESVIKRAILLARAENRTMITLKDLPEEIVSELQNAVAIEEQVLASLREKGFSRSSISEAAGDLGGLSRGTVAEYLRGECLKAFTEHAFDLERTTQSISLSSDRIVNERVRKKIVEYLSNITEVVDLSSPWEVTRAALKPKTKNLPQRYHESLERVAEGYFRGRWKPQH